MGQVVVNDQMGLIDLGQKIDGIDVLIVLGVGSGEGYRALSSWLKKEEGRFLVFIESKEELFLAAKDLSLAKDPKVRLLFYKEGNEEIFRQIAWEFVFLRFGFAVLDPQETEDAKVLFAQLEHYHRGTDLLASDCEDMGRKVLTNVLRNLSALPRSKMGHALEGKCTGMPAIVCGAGASLDAAMPLLARLKDRAVIFSGGSAGRALSAQGITPHFAAHVDPLPPRERFLGQDHFEVPLFYQGRFCHTLLESVHSPLVWMPDSGSYPMEAWLGSECGLFAERFDAGWTVANFCTAVAAYLGCSTVIFVGMDFSCKPDQMYAANMVGEADGLIQVAQGQQVLHSKRDWLMSAEWMGAFAKKHPEIRWLNATSGGIDLAGVERKELSAVVEEVLTQQWDVQGIVHALIAGAPLADVTVQQIDNVRKRVKESFEKGLSLCEALLKIWERHYPNSPLETAEYALVECELEQEICSLHFLTPLWNVWRWPILRTSFHPLGSHVHRLLFFKQALEVHLPHLRSYS